MNKLKWYAPALTRLNRYLGNNLFPEESVGWVLHRGHKSILLIPTGDKGPLGVIKVWHDQELAEQEYETLEELHKTLNPSIRETVPIPLCRFQLGRRAVTVQNFIDGSPMKPTSVKSKNFIKLASFHISAVRKWYTIRGEKITEVSSTDCELASRLYSRIKRLSPKNPILPCLETVMQNEDIFRYQCILHNDFNPKNILLDAGKISGVIDWEHSIRGPFLTDWFTFLCRYRLASIQFRADKYEQLREIIRLTYLSSGEYVKLCRDETRKLLSIHSFPQQHIISSWNLAIFKFAYANKRQNNTENDKDIAQLLMEKPPIDFFEQL